MGVTEVRGADGRRWTLRRRVAWPRRRVQGGWLPPFELDPTGITLLLFIPLVLAAILVLVFSAVAAVLELIVVFVLAYIWRGRWIIEAETDGPPAERKTWTVRGWRRSKQTAAEVAHQL